MGSHRLPEEGLTHKGCHSCLFVAAEAPGEAEIATAVRWIHAGEQDGEGEGSAPGLAHRAGVALCVMVGNARSRATNSVGHRALEMVREKGCRVDSGRFKGNVCTQKCVQKVQWPIWQGTSVRVPSTPRQITRSIQY